MSEVGKAAGGCLWWLLVLIAFIFLLVKCGGNHG